MLPFWCSIGVLSLAQGGTVALAGARRLPLAWAPRGRGWALVLPLSIVLFVIAGAIVQSASAHALTYLALVAVPLLAALALATLMYGARPVLALLVPVLFAIAWIDSSGLAGQAAAVALSALSCVALGVLLAAVTPPRWLAAGIFAMATADTALVLSHQLQKPNRALNAVQPPAGLPRLQAATFGTALMGYGDLFVAAVLGALVVVVYGRRVQLQAAALCAVLAVSFDLLFFFVDELPATVPPALTLAVLLLSRRAAGRDVARPLVAPRSRAAP